MKFNNLSILSDNIKLDDPKPDHTTVLLSQAEDHFRKSFLDQSDKEIRYQKIAYKTKLLLAFAEINSIIKKKPDTKELTSEQLDGLRTWYQRKQKLLPKLSLIKHSFDSLQAAENVPNAKNQAFLIDQEIYTGKGNQKDYLYTRKKIKSDKKSGLGYVIKDSTLNTNYNVVLNTGPSYLNNIMDLVPKKNIVNNSVRYQQKLRLVHLTDIKNIIAQKKLFAINIGVITALKNSISEIKEINYKTAYDLRYSPILSFRETIRLINKLFFVDIILTILLVAFIVWLVRSEAILLIKNEQSIIMAQQKMDLLLYMSHEIRNPLTSIRGFLREFGKTKLYPDQKEVLKSVKFSSDLLLQTLNDTLDAAKIESSKFNLVSAPFNPDLVIDEVIKNLTYGAIKKSLTIDYYFEGDKQVTVLGDALRLKQILFNLLGNAIKYTTIGGIIIKAELLLVKGTYMLHVNITDTGEGITQEQQINLFSKYHRTNSAQRQTGTGLGLYLCKVLVEIQGGKIDVESVINKGSSFTFYIPYE